jgi:hypothetical protein
MLALAVVWGLVLVIGAVLAIREGPPTAREQTSVAQAAAVVDRAAAQVASAASVDGLAVVAISGFERAGVCRVTLLRRGARYQRSVTAVVTAGTEQALLERVAARLPPSYAASVRGGTAPRLTGDAGFYVRITAGVSAPGQIRFVIDTGDCRPEGDILAAPQPSATSAQRAPVESLLATLGVAAQQWTAYQVMCPGWGSMVTVEAVGDGNPGRLDVALHGISAQPVVASADIYGYRSEQVGVMVRESGHRIVASSTTSCS